MFELNKNLIIKEENFENSKIYYIDNFYENPDSIVEYFLTTTPKKHKEGELNSKNGIYFYDLRHSIVNHEIPKVYEFLENICGQKNKNPNLIKTNMTLFKKNNFNDYENFYWWPHTDLGYTGILYLNKGNLFSGTNLYENLDPSSEPPNCSEHCFPWRSKSKYKVKKKFDSKYNQLVLFDAKKFIHGMNICNDDYFFNTYRLNQVFFFFKEKFEYL